MLMLLLQAPVVVGSTAPATTGVLFVLLFKLLFVIAAGLYLAFAFVVTRQISVMKNTLITTFSPTITTIGYAHLILALVVFVSFILFL